MLPRYINNIPSVQPEWSRHLYQHQSHARYKLRSCNQPSQLKHKAMHICSNRFMTQEPALAKQGSSLGKSTHPDMVWQIKIIANIGWSASPVNSNWDL